MASASALGKSLPRYYRSLAAFVRHAYFRRLCVHRSGHEATDVPRLVVSSHRNGALDGYVVLAAFPCAQFLVSIQLLKSRLMRVLFSGIPVVREKDRARFKVDRTAFANPVDAGVAHLAAGGDLVVFPEGSSEWGPHPLPYQKGAARMARTLLEQGAPFQVVPVGLHYPQPDRFRSDVDLVVGRPVPLPERGPDEDPKAWEGRIQLTIAAALDAVSVNSPDRPAFEAAEAHARAAVAASGSYAEAFLAAQAQPERVATLAPPAPPRPHVVDLLLVSTFLAVTAPILLLGALAGQRADARNTVSFFRVLGGLAGVVLTVPVWLGLALALPGWAAVIGVLAAWGFVRYPKVFDPLRPRL